MNETLNDIRRAISTQAPNIATMMAIGGFGAALIAAVQSAPEAKRVLEENEPFISDGGINQVIDTTKLLLPVYGKSAGLFVMSAGLVLLGNRLHTYRYNALTGLYFASQGHIDRLQEAIYDKVGEKKYDEIVSKASMPNEETHPVPAELVDIEEGVLCYDVFSRRYFLVDRVEDIESVVSKMNDEMFLDGWTYLNEFYWGVGLDKTKFGEQYGWNVERGPIEIIFGSGLTKRRKPIVTVDFRLEPKHIYSRFGERT